MSPGEEESTFYRKQNVVFHLPIRLMPPQSAILPSKRLIKCSLLRGDKRVTVLDGDGHDVHRQCCCICHKEPHAS